VTGGLAGSEATRERPVRVAFYCDADEVGGAEVSLGNLLATLAPRIDGVVIGTNRHVVDWLGGHRPGARKMLLPRIASDLELRPIAAQFRAILRLRPEILHVSLNSPWGSHWAILLGLAIPGVRVVAVEQLPQPPTRLRQSALKRLTAPHLAAHVAVGERSSREVARLSGIGPESVRSIYNGVPDLQLEALPRPAEGPVIGSLGRLEPQKGFDVLVHSLRELPGVTAVIVGDGSERDRLVHLAERLGVSERLVLPGRSNDARRYLTTFDVFVLPSRFEAFPLSIVEAMLAGLPVVATDVGSVAEAVVEGQTGRLVARDDPGSLATAVRGLLDDPDLARRLGRNGRQAAKERFTSAAMARAFEALYDEVIC
jgi:glycosyltransferase involved in cell wall biosynthesis